MRGSKKKGLVDFITEKPIKGPVKKIINQSRNLIKKTLVGLAVACPLVASSYFLVDYSKGWVNDRVKQGVEQYEQKDKQGTMEKFAQYEETDKEWTRERIEEELKLYGQQDKEWAKEHFAVKVPLERLVVAFNSTHEIINRSFYKTREGKIIPGCVSGGSSILLNGGYLLTAEHVIDEDFKPSFSEHYWGLVKYDHNKLFLRSGTEEYELEKIVDGKLSNLDYAVLKIKGDIDLPFYSPGLNLPDEVELGMRSIAVGFPLSVGRNIRLGNVSQVESKAGTDYLTFKNSIIYGDSGGPLFVVDDGKIKLVALSSMLTVLPDCNDSKIRHPTNFGYGLKVESILNDIKSELESGNLDEETVKELKSFLGLNK